MTSKNYFDLKFCPVYRPTVLEWETPLRYIESLDKTTGICKIIPPFKIKSDLNFKEFKTRNQVLQELDGKSRLANFIGNSLYKFHLNQGKIFKLPVINRVNLNVKQLFELKNSTDLYYKQKCMEMGLDQSHYLALRKLYQKWILPFKDWVKENGLQFNLIDASGSPLSARYTVADLDRPSIDLNMDDDSEPQKPVRKSTRPANPTTVYKHANKRDSNLPPKLYISNGTEVFIDLIF
jgi:jmjN domain